MSGKPFSKEEQLGRGPKKKGRIVANKKRLEQIRAAKDGPCRVCGAAPPNELHHLVPRSQGGDDQNANLVPLCHVCHVKVTAYDREACAVLRSNLIWTSPGRGRDLELGDEYAYAVEKLGEERFNQRYPVEWRKP